MSEEHSKLYYFLIADYCRIIVNILVLFGFIFFIIVLYKAFSKKESEFKLLFILMINVMICALLSILGYVFNWTIKYENKDENKNEKGRVLLFGDEDGFLCKAQSFFLTYFQTARESLLTSLTIIVFFNYKEHDVEKTKYKILIFLFCYGIPFISNIICFIFDGFGENDLFCFTKLEKFGKIFGIIHFLYLITLLVINLGLVSSIIYMDYRQGKKYENWLVDDKSSKFAIINSSLKKIIFYPIAQIFALIFPSIYRIGNNSEKVGTSMKWAKIAAIGNSLSAVLYTLIFIISNNMVLEKDNKENNISKPSENKEMTILE